VSPFKNITRGRTRGGKRVGDRRGGRMRGEWEGNEKRKETPDRDRAALEKKAGGGGAGSIVLGEEILPDVSAMDEFGQCVKIRTEGVGRNTPTHLLRTIGG